MRAPVWSWQAQSGAFRCRVAACGCEGGCFGLLLTQCVVVGFVSRRMLVIEKVRIRWVRQLGRKLGMVSWVLVVAGQVGQVSLVVVLVPLVVEVGA